MTPATPASGPDRDARPDTESEAAAAAAAKPSAMLPLERQVGWALVAFAAGLAAVSAATGHDLVIAGLGLITAAGLGLAVWRGHRVITMFAGLLAGLLVGSVPIEMVFIGYSGFLMLRLNKAQAKLNASRPRLTPDQRRQARAAKSVRTSAGKGGTTHDGATVAVTRQPAPNRRYTPPKSKPGQKK